VPKSCWTHRHKESPLNWTRQEQFELEKSSLDGMHAEFYKYRLQVIVYLKPAEAYPHLRYVFVSFSIEWGQKGNLCPQVMCGHRRENLLGLDDGPVSDGRNKRDDIEIKRPLRIVFFSFII
jgi:hypothetical protein